MQSSIVIVQLVALLSHASDHCIMVTQDSKITKKVGKPSQNVKQFFLWSCHKLAN